MNIFLGCQDLLAFLGVSGGAVVDLHFSARLEKEAGLCVDAEGNDFELISELINPPKRELQQFLNEGTLRSKWSTVMKGRGVEKAWMYEIATWLLAYLLQAEVFCVTGGHIGRRIFRWEVT